MCGITGFWQATHRVTDMHSTVKGMSDSIRHRGPDDEGQWTNPEAGIALGHRRLSILDLSPEGHQPMFSESGRFCIIFNGEVYNFEDLRRQLPGVHWRGHSDTEVMLAAIEAWGLDAAVKKFVGMFAFALWDRKERRLHLVRDRLGIKPVYYGWVDGAFLFASELKPFRAFPGFAAEIDRRAVALLLSHGYIPAPYSIYRNVYKLRPGSILTLDDPCDREPRISGFWSFRDVAEAGTASPLACSDAEAIEALDERLREAVRIRMVADVPLGAFLSGGIDSSTVVALMQAQSGQAVKTFSIGFREPSYNEADHARLVADHLGTDHTELYVTPQEAMEVIPRLSSMYDEPFADSSQVPTFLVSELTRRSVTVSLSGDGGDELFAGYPRYFLTDRAWKKMGRMPYPLRRTMAQAISGARPQEWSAAFGSARGKRSRNPGNIGNRLWSMALLLDSKSPEDLYGRLMTHSAAREMRLAETEDIPTTVTAPETWADVPESIQRFMYCDTVFYLPDDILTKVDRASMAVSLEARVPILDHRVVEFAWRVPLSMKVRDGQGKWLLRQVLYKYVPQELIDRPKKGFGVPIGLWMTGPLRDWAEACLDENRLRREGYLPVAPIRRAWKEHLDGTRSWEPYLWSVLMFQDWLGAQREPVGAAA